MSEAIIGDRLNTAKEEQKMRRLSLVVRSIYPLLVLAVVVVYLARYHP